MAIPKKNELVALLEDIALYMRILGENEFKVRAYDKGAATIAGSEAKLNEIAQGTVKLPGVGKGLQAAITEFLEKGTIEQHETLSKAIPKEVLTLVSIPGVGPKKAGVIYHELGVSSLGELEYACRENRLVTLKGFGQAIQKKILAGIELKKLNAGKLRIDTATEIAHELMADIKGRVQSNASVQIVGALGRHLEVVESFEFLIAGKIKKGFEGFFETVQGKKVDCLDHRFQVYEGLVKDHKVIVWQTESDSVSEVLFNWLCSDVDVRKQIEKNQKSLSTWEPSWCERVWVEQKRKPAADAYRLKQNGNVKGVFHNHTTFSDGADTLDVMVRAAEKLGYEYIGIADHSQSAFYAQGLKPEKVKEQRKLIEQLQKKVSIKIFHGIESDILADGKLDYPNNILDSFDFIVGSIHSRFQMKKEEMTTRITTALRNPALTMWGHPTGRLLLGRLGYELDWESCFQVAQEHDVVIELNSNPHRLDIDWRWGQELEKRKIKISINPDAHETAGLQDTVYGQLMAEKAMLPCSQIVNLMGVDEMEKFLWQKKKKKK